MNTRITSTPLPIATTIKRPKDAGGRTRDEELDLSQYAPKRRADFNYIPSPDLLRSLIERALEALSKGVFWDRGSIINLLL